ncbi:MAG: tripartite tricarboxylate transporter TctB family protein [Gemmatimonadaceae bacterium]|nr:tripartite tricarboxylate transporter TctB family protein [Acetobacteraceae bacterium]
MPTVVVEIATAGVMAGMALLALWDSRRIGAGWNEDGPQSGYFPFWIGLILLAASAGIMAQALRTGRDGGLFVTWPQARLVLSVLLPTIVYVLAIPPLGIYAASTLMIAYCMVALGGFAWWIATLSGLAAAAVVFVTFEIWFLVALPKGPIENAFGL